LRKRRERDEVLLPFMEEEEVLKYVKPIEEAELTLEERKLNQLYENPTFYSLPGVTFSENFEVIFPVERDMANKLFASYLRIPQDHEVVYGLLPKASVPPSSLNEVVNVNKQEE
jgi:5'-3' exonuclease